MGNCRYQKNPHHRFDNPHGGIFLPILCSRSSIKNVAMPGSFPEETSRMSPTVGCMGQVMKRNGRVVGFSTPYSLTNQGNASAAPVKANSFGNGAVSCHSAKYTKLMKLFSSKSLMGSATRSPSSVVAETATAATARRRGVSKSVSFGSKVEGNKEALNIAEIDPPLPVVKKVRKPEEEVGGRSLWLRRLGEVAPHLRTLEIQHNNPRNHQLKLVTV
ncbi:hypothetical protein SAY87_019621 [Trapa incisa]|uniref:Uncharacterized protein n=1 Tax=Trapa incisa TaxID=236973 RepID=A0AAN7K820_9MYRT|nr:hypothetical protein SAY87_019621 [Trapa incisa]